MSAGRPLNTTLHRIMKRTRNVYHLQIRKCNNMANILKKNMLLNGVPTISHPIPSHPDIFPLDNFPTDSIPPDNIPPRHFPTRTFSHYDIIPPGHFLTRHFPTRTCSHPTISHHGIFPLFPTILCDIFPLEKLFSLYMNSPRIPPDFFPNPGIL